MFYAQQLGSSPDSILLRTDKRDCRAVEIGALVGGYRVVRRIGRGGMGTVYEARDAHKTSFAMKVVRRANEIEWSALQNERAMLRHVRHRGIIAHRELFEHGLDGVLVMHLVRGPTLAGWFGRTHCIDETSPRDQTARVARAPRIRASEARDAGCMRSSARIREVLAAVADALAFLHRADVVHCDLKPSNIMLDSRGNPLIVDFGLARREGARTNEPFAEQGTAEYLAPECMRGDAFTKASDMYSLGLILFEALTGGLPRDHLLRKYGMSQSSCLDNEAMPKDLATLCDALLARDPTERPCAVTARRALSRQLERRWSQQSSLR